MKHTHTPSYRDTFPETSFMPHNSETSATTFTKRPLSVPKQAIWHATNPTYSLCLLSHHLKKKKAVCLAA